MTVSSRDFEDFRLVVLVPADSGTQTVLVLDQQGLLLYEETANQDGSGWVRVPINVARRAELESALALLRGQR